MQNGSATTVPFPLPIINHVFPDANCKMTPLYLIIPIGKFLSVNRTHMYIFR